MTWPFTKKRLTARSELTRSEYEALKSIYGTSGWKAFEKVLQNRMHEHQEAVRSEWYRAGADRESQGIATTRTACLFARYREDENLLQELQDEFAPDAQIPPPAEPPTVEELL